MSGLDTSRPSRSTGFRTSYGDCTAILDRLQKQLGNGTTRGNEGRSGTQKQVNSNGTSLRRSSSATMLRPPEHTVVVKRKNKAGRQTEEMLLDKLREMQQVTNRLKSRKNIYKRD